MAQASVEKHLTYKVLLIIKKKSERKKETVRKKERERPRKTDGGVGKSSLGIGLLGVVSARKRY